MIRSFILGNPRSGTSLLRIMLNAHPGILATPESGFMEWWYDKYRDWTIEDNQNESKLNDYIQDVLQSKKIETWGLDADIIKKVIGDRKPKAYDELSECIYLSRAELLNKNANVIVDKNNYYINMIDKIQTIWIDAKIIHLVRDGRDVACSYIALKTQNISSQYKPQLSTDISHIAEEWKSNNLKIMESCKHISSDQYISIRYEDILVKNQESLNLLCEFLGQEFNEQMLEYYKYNDEPASTMEWKKKTLEKPQIDNIGKYKTILTNEQIEQFNCIAGDMLKRFRYD